MFVRKYLSIMLILILLSGCAPDESSGRVELTVSAASSLADSLFCLKAKYEEENPNVEILYNFGGSGSLRRQIEYGAPIDIFLSASKKDYEQLKEGGFIETGSPVLENQLVWITSKDIKSKGSPPYVSQGGKIAIGTPKAVPVGTYAKEALQNIGLWDNLQDRIVYAKDARHVLTLVQGGSVQAGIVYESDAYNRKELGEVQSIDPEFYKPIEYFIGIIATEEDTRIKEGIVRDFYRFLLSKEAMKVFQEHGFQMKSR